MKLSIMTLSIMTLSIMTLSIMILTIMTLSIMLLSIMTLSIRALSIMSLFARFSINDIQHKGHRGPSAVMLSVIMLSYCHIKYVSTYITLIFINKYANECVHILTLQLKLTHVS
jgi:hypothetical protein